MLDWRIRQRTLGVFHPQLAGDELGQQRVAPGAVSAPLRTAHPALSSHARRLVRR
jgi:hypothetical protein